MPETKTRTRRPAIDLVVSALAAGDAAVEKLKSWGYDVSNDNAYEVATKLAADGFTPPVAARPAKADGFREGDAVRLRDKYVAKYDGLTDADRQTMTVDFYDAIGKAYAVKTDTGLRFTAKARHLEARAEEI